MDKVLLRQEAHTIGRHVSFLLSLFILLGSFISAKAQSRYYIEDGQIDFESDAPLELIEATTTNMAGVLDLDKKAFAIAIPISSFHGFNSALQREHFNENYMESEKYPKGIFRGIILDEINLRKNGYYTVTTQGKLNLHGIEKTRKVTCDIVVENGTIKVNSNFDVELVDHNIKIPTIVKQKLSETITINVDVNFATRK